MKVNTSSVGDVATTRFTSPSKESIVESLLANGLHVYATGSRVTSFYNYALSDHDYVVLDTDTWETSAKFIEPYWSMGDSGNTNIEFVSHKRVTSSGVVNVIFVNSKENFMKWVMATDLIRKVNPETKKERIELFDLIFAKESPF